MAMVVRLGGWSKVRNVYWFSRGNIINKEKFLTINQIIDHWEGMLVVLLA